MALVVVGLALYTGRDVLPSAPQVVLVQNMDQLGPQLLALIDEQVAKVRGTPWSAEAHGDLGLAYEANGLWNEAIECYRVVERLAPDEPVWPYRRALLMRDAGDVEGALTVLRRLSREHPDFPTLQQWFAESLLEAGDLAGAAQAFRRVVTLSPDSPVGYAGLGDVHIRRKEYGQARRLLEKSISIDPTYKVAHYTLGLAYRELGEYEAAKRALSEGVGAKRRMMRDALTDKLREQQATNLTVQLRVARRYHAAGRLDKAADILEVLLERFSDSTTVLNDLATVYLARKLPTKAMQLLLRAQKLGDTASATYVNLAVCCVNMNRLAEARSYAQHAVQVAPNDGSAHLTMAYVLIRSGRYDQARESLAAAERLSPGHRKLALLKHMLAGREDG